MTKKPQLTPEDIEIRRNLKTPIYVWMDGDDFRKMCYHMTYCAIWGPAAPDYFEDLRLY